MIAKEYKGMIRRVRWLTSKGYWDEDAFSSQRAERIDWIKAALQDSNAELHVGREGKKKRYDRSHRVALVVGDYVVVIRG